MKNGRTKNAPELPIGRFLKSKSLGGNRVILVVRQLEQLKVKVVAMPFRRWTFQLDGRFHIVELQHGFISGKRFIRVDGQTVETTGWMWTVDMGSQHIFRVGSCLCEFSIGRLWELGIGYELYVDGEVVINNHSSPHTE